MNYFPRLAPLTPQIWGVRGANRTELIVLRVLSLTPKQPCHSTSEGSPAGGFTPPGTAKASFESAVVTTSGSCPPPGYPRALAGAGAGSLLSRQALQVRRAGRL